MVLMALEYDLHIVKSKRNKKKTPFSLAAAGLQRN